ncbi:hypothetical protein KPG66_07435 [Mycetohabitans sp. B2]|uniref:Tc toxin subunit A-related protein n=1 Tax=Mycetohabitans sp. B2 TaxID=2841274 RepID=UPI001F238BFC|nr:neuraminidase-like domain-containing protein [Mycetohabitans sp. B2]MCF7695941.1 hypothetical protein [Mycetohabitans sp. B2]
MSVDHPILSQLDENRRDALVQFYLGQIAPEQGIAAGQLTTPEDLYQYLLLDNQVSAKVTTSWVAEAIASLQQYIHGIYNGMEPGHTTQAYERDDIDYWRHWQALYSVWGANQLLQSYPENYIDPTLRIRKTQIFKEFESSTAQSRINSDRVRDAALDYLRRFEQVSNLKVLSGYIDGPTHRDADYYFIGQEKTAPHRYYWRRARVQLEPANTRLNPTAWEEWQLIDVAFSDNVSLIRPVLTGGRLFVVWAEQHARAETMDNDGKVTEYNYDLKLAYLNLNGQWSAPMTAGTRVVNENNPLSFKLLAIAFESLAEQGAILAVALTRDNDIIGESSGQTDPIMCAWNAVFDPVVLNAWQKEVLKGLATQRFSDAQTLQNRFSNWETVFEGTDFEVDSVECKNSYPPGGGINQYFELEAECVKGIEECTMFQEKETIKTEVDLNVRGRCAAVRENLRIETLMLQFTILDYVGWDDLLLTLKIEVRPDYQNPSGESQATFSITQNFFNFGQEIQLLVNGHSVEGLKITPQPNSTTSVAFKLQKDIEQAIIKMSPQQIREGANFSFKIDGREPISFKSKHNRLIIYRESFKSECFGIWQGEETSGVPISKSVLLLNGGAVSRSVRTTSTSIDDSPYKHAFAFGVYSNNLSNVVLDNQDTPGYNAFHVKIREKPSKRPTIVESNGGQFLALNDDDLNIKYVRLNTLFAGQLIQRASFSLARLLHWDTQHIEEPGTPDASETPVLMDFDGANGRYFWELFFHMPHLVAHQLTNELNYADAQDWLHYLFNPSALVIPAERDTPSYWQVRPLIEKGDDAYEVDGPTDPDAIAYSRPEHYCKKVYLDYVHNLIAWADSLYRRLTRDSLTEAKLLYVRALSLMGNAPSFRGVSRWTPASLEELDRSDVTALTTFEATLDDATLSNLPAQPGGPVMLDLLDVPAFRLPLNQQLLDVWDTLASRLSNLRHNLTLDGKPMSLPLFDALANPRDLLRAQAAGAGPGQRNPGAHLVIPPYRFIAILPRAQNAVDTLCRFGEQVRQYMEAGDRCAQEELQQRHVIELADFAEQLQQQYVEQAQATEAALHANKASIALRYDYYREQVERDVSAEEIAALAASNLSQVLQAGVSALSMAGAAASTAPNIFGMANGGMEYGAPFQAAAHGLATQSAVAQIMAMNLETSDRYRRRREEWAHQRDMAQKEMEAIDAQIAAQAVQIQAAQTALKQQCRAKTQAQELYTFLSQTRGSKISLYRWLQSQMATLYFQAYDAVTAFCLSAQACWQYEIGDYDTQFIQPDVWFDNYHGLGAGEALKLALLKMESAFVHRNERRLELIKTVSLRQLIEKQAGNEEEKKEAWSKVIKQLKDDGQLPFELTARMLDEDYPGLYLRQLLRVSVTLPAVIGPYQNIRARLLQTSSQTVIKPSLAAVCYTHDPNDPQADTTDIRFNLRPTGQIALSTGLDDSGMVQMSFDDGRYFPFEGTGAISSWLLEFPRHEQDDQQALFEAMTDIVIQFQYTAVDGGRQLAQDVEALLNAASKSPANPSPLTHRGSTSYARV